LNDEKIVAAAAAANARSDQGNNCGAALAGPIEQEAKNALKAGIALVQKAEAKTQEDLDKAEALLEEAAYGTLSPFWAQCSVEFVERYKFAKHASAPYVKYDALTDFVLPPSALPPKCKIAIIGDWGTGEARAQSLLNEIARSKPDILLHLGDIYYSCTAAESNLFHENCKRAFPDGKTRFFSLCGNHDMYGGGGPYYALLEQIDQPASFFCLRNQWWQVLAGDTGWNDFRPSTHGADATWIRDRDEGDSYSELDWHKDKLVNSEGRKTILLTHHQLFTRNVTIDHDVSLAYAAAHKTVASGKLAVNQYLMEEFRQFLPQISLWIWGHEHNQAIYKPFQGLDRGRCVGASAIPVPIDQNLYSVSSELDGQAVPELIDGDPTVRRLQPDSEGLLHQLGYAIVELDQQAGQATYYQFDPPCGRSSEMYVENLSV
jgi:predicted phosphodiesterase